MIELQSGFGAPGHTPEALCLRPAVSFSAALLGTVVSAFAPIRSFRRLFALASKAVLLILMGMESHAVLREVLEKCNAKQIAADMGLSLSLIYKWAEPSELHGSGTVNPLDRIEALVRCSNDLRIVQWICERAGGFFIKNPKAIWPHPHYLIPATNQIVQEFADLLAVVASAAADNSVSKQESKAIRARWEELKTATEGFVRCCEEGNFSPLRRDPPSAPPGQVQP